ncbi:hypothetical protein ACS0TY_008184 [Phlomoides rotata]
MEDIVCSRERYQKKIERGEDPPHYRVVGIGGNVGFGRDGIVGRVGIGMLGSDGSVAVGMAGNGGNVALGSGGIAGSPGCAGGEVCNRLRAAQLAWRFESETTIIKDRKR